MNVDVPANALVQVTTYGGVKSLTGSTGTAVPLDIRLVVDSGATLVRMWRIIVNPPAPAGSGESNWNYSTVVSLPAGQHTFQLVAGFGMAPGANVDISGNWADILHQGELDVTIIKQ